MDFNAALRKLQERQERELEEALTPDQQKAANAKKAAIASAKQKNRALTNVPDEELDYDVATNTVTRLSAQQLAQAKKVKVKI